jgi:hypothetical protein
MRLSHAVTLVLWFVPLALQCVIAVVMSLRRLTRRFPVFFSYTIFLPARDAVLAYLPYPGPRYSRVYWWGEAGAVLLSLGVIAETIRYLVAPYRFLRVVFRVFWIVGVIAAASALAILVWSKGPEGSDLVLESIILFERSARFLQVCLLIAVIYLISRLGLAWRSYPVGITAGFGIYAALDLALLEFRAHLHLITDTVFALLRPAAYNLAVLVWTFYFLGCRSETSVQSLPSNDMASWNHALTEYIHKWYRR